MLYSSTMIREYFPENAHRHVSGPSGEGASHRLARLAAKYRNSARP